MIGLPVSSEVDPPAPPAPPSIPDMVAELPPPPAPPMLDGILPLQLPDSDLPPEGVELTPQELPVLGSPREDRMSSDEKDALFSDLNS